MPFTVTTISFHLNYLVEVAHGFIREGGGLLGYFMTPALLTLKIIAATEELKKFQSLLLKSPVTFADPRNILTLGPKLRIMANSKH